MVFYKSVCDEDCVQLDAWKPGFSIVSWVELGGRGQVGHFMAKRDVETWGGAPQSFFMVVEAFASKLTVVVLLGRDPISNNQITTAECRRLKRSKSGKRLGFVSPKWLLLIT